MCPPVPDPVLPLVSPAATTRPTPPFPCRRSGTLTADITALAIYTALDDTPVPAPALHAEEAWFFLAETPEGPAPCAIWAPHGDRWATAGPDAVFVALFGPSAFVPF